MVSIKVVAGLGNPGSEYLLTRHNAGVRLVEKLAEMMPSDYGWRGEKEAIVYKSGEMILAKAKEKFMNQSGEWVRWLMEYQASNSGTKDLWVVHDDLDIALGEYKIQFGVGPKDHGGINSIENILRTKDFWRVRIGVDNRSVGYREAGDEYVLKRFPPEELARIDEVITKVAEEIKLKLNNG